MSSLSRRSFLATASGTAAAIFTGKSRADYAGDSFSPSNDLPAELTPLVKQKRTAILDAMAQHDIPGAAVSLIYKGKAVWTDGFGVTDRIAGRPVNTRTIFSIQSTTKNITATAILLAVQKGILNLDHPITTYLPGFSVNSRFESAPQEKMTLRLLLSHTAGFTHEAPIGNNFYPAFPSFEAHVLSISETWLRYPVGERYAYSNLGVDLAGYILQKASGVSFAEWVKATVFDSLGMMDSTCSTPIYVARENRAVGQETGYNVVPLEIPLIPSGGVYTSARDLTNYALFHLNNGTFQGNRVLDEKLLNEMRTVPPPPGQPYGLGIGRRQIRFGDTVVDWFHHEGGGFGFGSVFSFYPKAQLAWVGLFNRPIAEGYQALGDSLSWNILTSMYGDHVALNPAKGLRSIDMPRDKLERYVGTYIGRGDSIFELKVRDNVLGMQLGTEFKKLIFSSPVDAFLDDGEAMMFSYEPPRRGETARWKCPNGPSDGDLDYNEGPGDAPGPDSKHWEEYIGDYAIKVWGKPETGKVHIKNGYLHLDDRRLIVETKTGLFFSADGEALDFRRKVPTWRNIPLEKIRAQI